MRMSRYFLPILGRPKEAERSHRLMLARVIRQASAGIFRGGRSACACEKIEQSVREEQNRQGQSQV